MVDRNPQTGSLRKSSEDQRNGDIWRISVGANRITSKSKATRTALALSVI